jgi:hypothetical protein
MCQVKNEFDLAHPNFWQEHIGFFLWDSTTSNSIVNSKNPLAIVYSICIKINEQTVKRKKQKVDSPF